ncbi:MAG: LemA family protein, partial [Alphaproteobacteria bacterium]|nr:LemA family protein [Alphaproteobacteria bacterium]
MSLSAYLLLAVGVVLVFGIVLYNRLVALRQATRNAFADIDVQLKQRYDLVPNLVATVKGYAAHESGVFEKVTAARAAAMKATTLAERGQAEGALSG